MNHLNGQGMKTAGELRIGPTGDKIVGRTAQEGAPCRRRRTWPSSHVLRNGGAREPNAELRQFALDARCTPQDVLLAHAADEHTYLRGNRRPSWLPPSMLPPHGLAKRLSAPAADSVCLHDLKGFGPSRPHNG